MARSAAVFAADEATAGELAAALGAAGYTIAARATMVDEAAIAAQLTAWIGDPSISVVLGTSTDASRAALVPRITKRLLGFSDLREIDGGRCGNVIAVLVPVDAEALASAVTKALPRIESELVGKPAPPPPKVNIRARPTGSSTSSKHLPPLAQRLPVATIPPARKEESVVARIPPAPAPRPKPPVNVSGGRAVRTEEIEKLEKPAPHQGAPLAGTPAPKAAGRATATPPPPPPAAMRAPKKAPPAEPAASATDEPPAKDAPAPLEAGAPVPVLTSLMSALVAPAAEDPEGEVEPRATADAAPSSIADAGPPAQAPAATDSSPAPVRSSSSLFAGTSAAAPALEGIAAPVASSSLASFDATAGLEPRRSRRRLVIGLAAGGVALAAAAFFVLGSSSSTSASPSQTLATSTLPSGPDEPPPSTETPSVATPVTDDAGSATEPEVEPAIEPVIEPVIEPGIEIDQGAAPARAPGATRPATARSASTVSSKPAPAPRATIVAPVSADGCDKVSCVIDAYARPCCEPYRPRKPGDTPVELDRAMITSGMRSAKAAVIRCGEQHATAKGIVRLAMKVRPDGTVEEAGVSETPDPALGECVSSAAKKVTFAKTENGGSFAYPFKF